MQVYKNVVAEPIPLPNQESGSGVDILEGSPNKVQADNASPFRITSSFSSPSQIQNQGVGANPGPKSKAEQNVSSASQSSSPPMTVSQVRNPFKVPTQFQRNYSTRPITNQESDTKKEIVITQYYWQHRNQEYLLAIHLIVVITNLRKRKALMKHNLKQKCKANHFVK